MGRNISREFVVEARRALDFLLDEYSFEGYESGTDTVAGTAWVRYNSRWVQVEAGLDPRDRVVAARIRFLGPEKTWTDLESLLAVSGMRLPKGTLAKAVSVRGIRVALLAHARSLRMILPLLSDEDGCRLIREALN
jgi:hypothetical protein